MPRFPSGGVLFPKCCGSIGQFIYDPQTDLLAGFGLWTQLLGNATTVDETSEPFAYYPKRTNGVARDLSDRLFVATDTQIGIIPQVSAQTGPLQPIAYLDGKYTRGPSLAVDGARLYFAASNELWIWNLSTIAQGALPDVRVKIPRGADSLELVDDVLLVLGSGVTVFPSAQSITSRSPGIVIPTGPFARVARLSQKGTYLVSAEGATLTIWTNIRTKPVPRVTLTLPDTGPPPLVHFQPGTFAVMNVEVYEP